MNRRELLKQMALLGGGTLMGSVANAVLAGVDLHTAPAASPFNAKQRALVAQLSERIIPSGDTPGAIAAGVPLFIERMVGIWYGSQERLIFCSGLDACDDYCREHFQQSALTCSGGQHDEALRHFEQVAQQYAQSKPPSASLFATGEDTAAPFFAKLKELTVIGYYTSEIGAAQELRYNPMPMRYDGDVDFGPNDRAWSWGGLL